MEKLIEIVGDLLIEAIQTTKCFALNLHRS